MDPHAGAGDNDRLMGIHQVGGGSIAQGVEGDVMKRPVRSDDQPVEGRELRVPIGGQFSCNVVEPATIDARSLGLLSEANPSMNVAANDSIRG